VFELDERFRQQTTAYESLYGTAPKFKAGAHCGSVVVTEVGRIRSYFDYHGDTVNVASRIASLCSSEGKQFLISESLLGQLELPDWCLSESIGQRELRGKSEMPNLFEVKRRGPDGSPPNPSEVAANLI